MRELFFVALMSISLLYVSTLSAYSVWVCTINVCISVCQSVPEGHQYLRRHYEPEVPQ